MNIGDMCGTYNYHFGATVASIIRALSLAGVGSPEIDRSTPSWRQTAPQADYF